MSFLVSKSWMIQTSSITNQDFELLRFQIAKDFSDEDFMIKLNEVKNQTELFFLCENYFQSKFNVNPTAFSQQMYLVDLPEKFIKELYAGKEIDWSVLTNQIIRREYLKVVLKKYYSGKE